MEQVQVTEEGSCVIDLEILVKVANLFLDVGSAAQVLPPEPAYALKCWGKDWHPHFRAGHVDPWAKNLYYEVRRKLFTQLLSMNMPSQSVH